jgi:phosphoserine aminotransferase
MKHTIILFSLLTILSCTESNIIDSDIIENQQTEIYNTDKSDFLNKTGYVELIINKASGKEWKDHYISVTAKLKDHELLNQYRLNAVTNMIDRSDFLSTIQKSDADFLMKMFNDFQTKGSLETKHLMLNKLAEFFPKERILKLRSAAYPGGVEYQKRYTDKLKNYIEKTLDSEGEYWREQTVQSYQNRVDDANNFLHYFEPNS